MAASDHLHPVQLRMFITARELHDMPSAEVGDPRTGAWPTHEEMWAAKKEDNDEPWRQASYDDSETLSQSVAKHGVKHPVRIAHRGEIAEIDAGHHRIQAAYDANPESYVPVTHKRMS